MNYFAFSRFSKTSLHEKFWTTLSFSCINPSVYKYIDDWESWKKLLYSDINYFTISVQILLKEICKNYENSSHSAGGCEQNEIKTVCIDNTDTPLRHQEKDKLYGK